MNTLRLRGFVRCREDMSTVLMIIVNRGCSISPVGKISRPEKSNRSWGVNRSGDTRALDFQIFRCSFYTSAGLALLYSIPWRSTGILLVYLKRSETQHSRPIRCSRSADAGPLSTFPPYMGRWRHPALRAMDRTFIIQPPSEHKMPNKASTWSSK